MTEPSTEIVSAEIHVKTVEEWEQEKAEKEAALHSPDSGAEPRQEDED